MRGDQREGLALTETPSLKAFEKTFGPLMTKRLFSFGESEDKKKGMSYPSAAWGKRVLCQRIEGGALSNKMDKKKLKKL